MQCWKCKAEAKRSVLVGKSKRRKWACSPHYYRWLRYGDWKVRPRVRWTEHELKQLAAWRDAGHNWRDIEKAFSAKFNYTPTIHHTTLARNFERLTNGTAQPS